MRPELTEVGIYIFAGTVWFVLAGVFGGLTYTTPLLVAVGLAFILLVAFSARAHGRLSGAPGKGRASDETGRAFWIINGLQFAAILIGIAVVTQFRRDDLVPAVIEAIVGAHFLPLARIFENRMHVIVGLLMLAGSAAAFTQHGSQAVAVACVSAGVVLWTSAAARIFGLRAGSFETE